MCNCNLGEGLYAAAVDEARITSIVAVMESLNKTIYEVMDVLNIPTEEQPRYKKLVEEYLKDHQNDK
jgi:cupin superfamily acireductone dioxygenase involved in methionine salvage